MRTYEFIVKGTPIKNSRTPSASGWINAKNKEAAKKRLKKQSGVRYVKLREEKRKYFPTSSWLK